MPSTSKKQHNFMAAVAHNPAFAKKVGVPQSVGRDFSSADKGRKFAKGGDTMAESKKAMEQRHARVLKTVARGASEIAKEEAREAKEYRGGGFVRAADGIASKGKTKAKQITMCGGGKVKK